MKKDELRKVMNAVNQKVQERDQELLRRFCHTGTFFDESGNTIYGVCNPMSTQEFLNFIHVHDALLIEAISKAI